MERSGGHESIEFLGPSFRVMSFRVQAVDPLHYPFRPLGARFSNAVRDRGAVRHSEQVVRSLHVHGAKDVVHGSMSFVDTSSQGARATPKSVRAQESLQSSVV